MKVISNYHVRELCPWHDLPASERSNFDYLDEDQRFEDRFVRAWGSWYDVYDAQNIHVRSDAPRAHFGDVAVDPDSPLAEWDGVVSESFWTGVVFRFLRGDLRNLSAPDECGYVQVGRFVTE